MPSQTNKTTTQILDDLLARGVLAWRHNTLPIPMVREGVFVGYRPSAKIGLPDILGIIPPHGIFLGIEIKTGRDKLRPEQIAFHDQARRLGAIILVISTFEDYQQQIEKII